MTDFRTRLRAGELLVGTMLTLPLPELSELAAQAGADWLFLDGEHSTLDLAAMQRLMMATGGRCASLVRVPGHDATTIARALDAGADGVIVPQVNDAATARAVVRAAKYPPAGTRGVGAGRASAYGARLAEAVREANARTCVVVQVEHVDAVACVEEIAAVEGLDALFVGPYDLSASMGRPGELAHPEVRAAITRVLAVAEARGLARGIFARDGAGVREWRERGCRLLCAGVDAGLYLATVFATLADARGDEA